MRRIEPEMPLVLASTNTETGTMILLTDVSQVEFKHYAIAVDIFDTQTDAVLEAVLSTMNRGDEVTLITFGDHLESAHFTIADCFQEIVNRMMRRRETGCNVASALYELDRTVCDDRILISNGNFDDGPEKVQLKNYVKCISPGNCAYPEIQMQTEIILKAHLVLKDSGSVSFRKQIRALLGKPRPNFYSVVVTAGARFLVPPLAFGGCQSLFVGEFLGNIKLEYYDEKGVKFKEEIKKN